MAASKCMLNVLKLPNTGESKVAFTASTSAVVPAGLKGTSGPESPPQALRATHAAASRVTERFVDCRTRIGRASVS
jgi:hypothetical protein